MSGGFTPNYAENIFSAMTLKRAVFQQGARALNSGMAHLVPHSFLFAILLNFFAYLMGILVTYQGPFDMVKYWVHGVWNLLSFSMQMVLLVAAGFSVATAPVSQQVLRFLAEIPHPAGRSDVSHGHHRRLFFCTGAWGLSPERSWPGKWGGGSSTWIILCWWPALLSECARAIWELFAADPLVIRKAVPFLEKAMGMAPNPELPWSLIPLAGFLAGVTGVVGVMGFICPEEKEATRLPPPLLERFEREDRAEEISIAAEREIHQRRKAAFRRMVGTQPLAGLADLHHGLFLHRFLVLRQRVHPEPQHRHLRPFHPGPLPA